ncbi:MAG: class IV adenylate cyclase [Planctomycetota bacterium]
MHNVEFKAELRDLSLARAISLKLGATHAGDMRQVDTYYKVATGRLKRREITFLDEAGKGEPPEVEYIFYDRPDLTTPRLSHYVVYDEPTARERFGTRDLPVELVVAKTRRLFLTGPVRIHLDEVEGLGTFIEFEAVVSRAHTVRSCHEMLAKLRTDFQPALGEAIAVSYSDLQRIEQQTQAEAVGDPFGLGEASARDD